MATTKKLFFNSEGISLILLVIIILGLGILASGFVSFMGSKLRGYPHEVKSYQALNLANSGVEFAIRYAYEKKDDFFSNPRTVIPSPQEPPLIIKFGGGKIELNYDSASNTLISKGIKDATKRVVRIKNFAGFIQGGVSLVPGLGPYSGGGIGPGHGEDPKNVFIPLLNNMEKEIYIFKIHINLKDQSGHNPDYLQTISFRKDGVEKLVYNYIPDTTCRNEETCPPCRFHDIPREPFWNEIPLPPPFREDPPCKAPAGIEIPEPDGPHGDATLIFNVARYYVLQTGISTEIIHFKSAANKGRYNLKIFWADNPQGENLQMSIFSFVIN